MARSGGLHGPWVQPPRDAAAYAAYLQKARLAENAYYFAWYDDGLVGALHLGNIVRGALQGAYLGYYAFEPLAGRGLMRQAMAAVLDEAFGNVGLHRVEANIQPANARSRKLVAALGFRLEGFSPRYLKIDGIWRDHERWALLRDEWDTA